MGHVKLFHVCSPALLNTVTTGFFFLLTMSGQFLLFIYLFIFILIFQNLILYRRKINVHNNISK